ncbi:serine-threonine protein kinase 19 [Lipomyces oligophaga]|uniref:serine-threonine protein kinase 19 n=1 Tax=Lipomyces oligophaga TaxID=45792 RepID=UPI0034CDE26D
MISHLHAIYPTDPTYIDRELQRAIEAGSVRKITTNNNSGDIVIESKYYFRILRTSKKSYPRPSQEIFDRFEALLRSKPESTQLTNDDFEIVSISNDSDVGLLSMSGFLVLEGHAGVYKVSLPNIGLFHKLVFNTRKWLISLLQRSKFKEMLEKNIHERWDAAVNAHWRDFKGVRFEWVMLECKGAGWVEPFETPIGIGWRLTGKR